jgi:hypothetical protein
MNGILQMIRTNRYYKCLTEFGIRTVKTVQELESSDIYGIYSISNYKNSKDSKGMIVPTNSKEATEDEIAAWNRWFN